MPAFAFNFDTIRDDASAFGGIGRGRSRKDQSEAAKGEASPDAPLLARLRAGDEQALHEVFDRYLTPLVRFADAAMGTSGGAAGDAGDVVSDVLVSLWERRAILASVHNLRAYLYRAVRNRALNHRRSVRRSDERVAAYREAGERPGSGVAPPAPDATVEGLELQRIVWRAVHAMREPMRTVAILRWSHGLSFGEIADIAGISENVARVQASRAVVLLRATVPALLR